MPAGYPKPKHPGLASKGASRASNRAMVGAARRKQWSGGLGTGLKTLQKVRNAPRATTRKNTTIA